MQLCQRLQPEQHHKQLPLRMGADQQGQCRHMCTLSLHNDTASMKQQHHWEG